MEVVWKGWGDHMAGGAAPPAESRCVTKVSKVAPEVFEHHISQHKLHGSTDNFVEPSMKRLSLVSSV